MNWFYVVVGLAGLVYLLSAVYEWTWLWKFGRGAYWPRLIGWRNTRLLSLFSGTGGLGVALSFFLQSLFNSNSPLIFVLGFAISAGLTIFLFNSRKDQSIVAFILNKDK